MVKKKRPDQEEENNETQSKITDNKENTDNRENLSDYNYFNPGSEAISTEGSDTDKPVVEEISFEVKLAEMQDKYIRLSAEFDNYRKRTLREKMELSKYASENVLLKIIPFMDDFERALKHMEDSPECNSIKNGIELIYTKFSEFLKQNGIKEIESMNILFNVDLHEAVAKIPVEEEEKKGKVVDVISKGYYLNDKVLRFSKVVVGE